MAKNYNPTIAEDARRIFNLKAGDMLGSDIGNMIVPTIEVKRKVNISRRGTVSNNTAVTVYTTPTDKDFYIVGMHLGMCKDATATSLWTRMSFVVDGVTQYIMEIPGFTLTAQNEVTHVDFTYPVLVDRGSVIQVLNNTAVGNITAVGTIWGFTVETTTAP